MHIIKTPSGRYVFAGNVPALLAYVNRDGGPPSEEQLRNAKIAGPAVAGLRPRSFATEREARLAALEIEVDEG